MFKLILFVYYSRLSLSRIPRDPLKYFEISLLRHIRFAELRKIRLTNTCVCNWTLEVRDILKNIVGKRRNCSSFPQYSFRFLDFHV